ncbi:prepilin-type N-terminal cleavage/methylation domain-containing protein [Anaerosolibacter carboniphilus]|uniref:Prepilin-type N-terminal cleavage/methylation domain-containing protein n=1 Tax=Anaerosolibacter carboniphilus TaxID=1417629 RepID=A0A841KT73_9FIRM|nr:prepilin-type N-terminal cleavage/methylation domain-containing protein [Anaerosolibacter carboniphilus]MBB6216611.1 prepilin-type N-terminal cleavage/methylation domain-containing protein [Anaerosolibacter carboniphilus]
MENKTRHYSQKGFTLIETILSLTLLSIIILALGMFLSNSIRQHIKLIEIAEAQRKSRLALNYIEKRMMECNQLQFTFDPKTNTFTSKDYQNNEVWIDLSGNKRFTNNTLIYFYKVLGELRVNKKGEHNVLIDGIKDIKIIEILPGKLIEIEIHAENLNHSIKSRMNICYR